MPEAPVDYSRDTCSIGVALDLIGEKWSLQIVREAFLGSRRFDDFLQLVGCGRAILALRLATLVEHGVLERVPYREPGLRTREEYVLTDKGHEIFPIIVALLQWGDKWNVPGSKPSLLLRHAACRAEVRAEIRCAKGHGPLGDGDTYARPGPGAVRAS